MKPRVHLATAAIPGGTDLRLFQHGDDFMIVLDRNETVGIVILSVSALPLLHALFAGIFSRRGPLP